MIILGGTMTDKQREETHARAQTALYAKMKKRMENAEPHLESGKIGTYRNSMLAISRMIEASLNLAEEYFSHTK